MKQVPGKTLLKVVGILLIVFGAIALCSCMISLTTLRTQDTRQLLGAMGITEEMLLRSSVLGIIESVLYIAAGIIGVKNCSRPEKARLCVTAGVILLVMVVGEAVFALVQGSFGLLGVLVELILPLLYFWGAMRNRQAAAEATASPLEGIADILEVSGSAGESAAGGAGQDRKQEP